MDLLHRSVVMMRRLEEHTLDFCDDAYVAFVLAFDNCTVLKSSRPYERGTKNRDGL